MQNHNITFTLIQKQCVTEQTTDGMEQYYITAVAQLLQ